MLKCKSIKQIIVINIVVIIFSVIFVILAHAFLPASVDVKQFNGIFVEWFGFPAVATFYFILIFTHCAISVRFLGVRADVPKLQTGIRLGVAFAMLYMLGMQEVIVESSPFSSWGLGYVKYQLIMGIGDGIPAILLCLAISYFTLNKNENKSIHKMRFMECIKIIGIIAIAFFIERTIGYESGLVFSDSEKYPVPCYVWTGMFGVMMGCSYVILYPLISWGKKRLAIPFRFTAVIGVNWIIFNIFIGLILKDTMFQALLRSGIDVMVLFIASAAAGRYIIRSNDI